MNIFYLDNNPEVCAKMHLDKHVVKMILEYAQLMSTAHRVLDGYEEIEKRYVHGSLPARWRNVRVWTHPDAYMHKGLMKASHVSHPSNVWLRQSKANYLWLCQMWLWLMKEYTHRYGKHHACENRVEYLMDAPKNIPNIPFTEPTPAMPDAYKVPGDSIKSYKNYYIHDKVRFAKWTRREVPQWFAEELNNANV
jgi:hypothetical protein